jgi:tight adherence protein C
VNPVTLVGLAWMALVLAGGWRWRPRPRRLRTMAGGGQGTAPPRSLSRGHSSAARAVADMAGRASEAVGSAVLRRLGRPAEPARSRRLGRAILAASAALPILPAAALPFALLAWAGPGVKARRVERRRLAALAADLPDVVDLLVLAVGAGLTVPLAVRSVARRAPGPLGAELARACAEASLGRRLGDALDDLPARAGEACRPLVAALLASERYGAPLGAGLERLALEVRADRRRRAEEAARKVPVKLLFPLVTCTLPAFALLTVAPLIASAIRSLRL